MQENKTDEVLKEYVTKAFNWLTGLITAVSKHSHLEQWMFTATVALILGTIITLSALNKINESTIGTLLGSAIGYALGKYSGNKKSG